MLFKPKTSKQLKKLLLALSMVATTLASLVHPSTPKHGTSLQLEASWHLGGKLKLEKH